MLYSFKHSLTDSHSGSLMERTDISILDHKIQKGVKSSGLKGFTIKVLDSLF